MDDLFMIGYVFLLFAIIAILRYVANHLGMNILFSEDYEVNRYFDNYIKSVEKKENNSKEPEDMNRNTREQFLKTLTNIGCNYETLEDSRIVFAYQGWNFLVSASDSSVYVWIYDIAWKQVNLYDVEEMSRMKRAVNKSNMDNIITSIYTIDETENVANVHCQYAMLFLPEIPDIGNYLKSILNTFFTVHHTIDSIMSVMKEKEAK